MTCANCKLSFSRLWISGDHCLFCTKYLPMRDTYLDILQDSRSCYLVSGWWNESQFYKDHLKVLKEWCAKWHIRANPESQAYEAQLLELQNPTRDYWH